MYSSSDFERLFIRYKAEAMPEGESIQAFCLKNKVPYNLFHKWYKDTRHQIVPERKTDTESVPVRIMIDIRMTNGMRIQQRNLTFPDLKNLIVKLEGLC